MRLTVVDTERCVGCQSCMFACSRRTNKIGFSGSCINVRSDGGVKNGFIVVVCKTCEDPPCAKVCPHDALVLSKKGGIRLKKSLCNGCGNCREACIIGAVQWNEEDNKPAICIQCGSCEEFCPHGVLSLENGDDDDKKGGNNA